MQKEAIESRIVVDRDAAAINVGPLEIEVSQPPSSTHVTNRAAPLEAELDNAVISDRPVTPEGEAKEQQDINV